MKKTLALLLAILILTSALSGCAGSPAAPAEPEPVDAAETPAAEVVETPAPKVYDDGRARPSSCGSLQVLNGKLCSESGEPVMLRGVSTNGLIQAEDFLNEQLFDELAGEIGVNVFRLAMYTYGVGIIGYCTDGDKDRHK